MMHKNIMEMSEQELVDFMDENLEEYKNKLKGKDKEMFSIIHGTFRVLQFQLNFIRSKAEMGVFHYIAHMKNLPEDIKEKVMADFMKEKEKADVEILRELQTKKPQDADNKKDEGGKKCC